MKVGTDGVLLGAWTPIKTEKSILDIGCGTGVISLMLAQRSRAEITSIDIDLAAYQQAQDNFKNSKWSNRLFVQHASLQDFEENNQKKFELIVSNPPFFSAESIASSRAIARSQNQLSHKQLIKLSKNLLSQNGRFCCVVPIEQQQLFIDYGNEVGLYPSKICEVKGKLGGKIKRTLLEFTTTPQEIESSELVIELENRHQYSEAYTSLLKDYLIIF